jgi:hypothetical protein
VRTEDDLERAAGEERGGHDFVDQLVLERSRARTLIDHRERVLGQSACNLTRFDWAPFSLGLRAGAAKKVTPSSSR